MKPKPIACLVIELLNYATTENNTKMAIKLFIGYIYDGYHRFMADLFPIDLISQKCTAVAVYNHVTSRASCNLSIY
jgi:hypothetical protein